jgi:hypothetical protein
MNTEEVRRRDLQRHNPLVHRSPKPNSLLGPHLKSIQQGKRKLLSIGLSTRPLNTSTPLIIKAFAILSKSESFPQVPHLIKQLLNIPATTFYPHRHKPKRLNNLNKIPSFAQHPFIYTLSTIKT